ncbi:hypoxanthine-guanine phosphoribosyltransferase [Trifolium repens]|nr:hypoxanthine-guanine phosphoribosyltransferase [Trifolium repens]
MAMHSHLEKILWTEDQISLRISQLATQIVHDFPAPSSPPIFIGVLTGAFIFIADLVRKINLPITIDFVSSKSYGSGTVSNCAPTISRDLNVDINGRHVILVEDIVDTGHTLYKLIAHMKSKGASSVSVCTLLDKPARRKVSVQLVGEGKFYRGFECPDNFVVGYGMDFDEFYRNLPYIGVLKPEHYSC